VNDRAVIVDCTVTNSIVDCDAVVIGNGGRISHTIIGVGAQIKGEGEQWHLERAVLGDGDRVSFFTSG